MCLDPIAPPNRYPPNTPKPSLAYVAEQRKANQPPLQDPYEDIRSHAPFWMLQSKLSTNVPDENKKDGPFTLSNAYYERADTCVGKCQDKFCGPLKYHYNQVDFVPVLKQVDQANGGSPLSPPAPASVHLNDRPFGARDRECPDPERIHSE